MDQINPISVEGQDRALESAAVASAFHKATASGKSDQDIVISFGPFHLFATQRLLLKGDAAVRIGSRAFDILIALAMRRGELVGKQQLMAWVWPDTFVEPANLTVHVSALRRTLGDGRAGNRYIVNIPGRGYLFVAPVKSHDR